MRIILFSLMAMIMFTGCPAKIIYVDRPIEVKVPVRCKIPLIKPLVKGRNMSESSINIEEYTKNLEGALRSCKE